MSLRPLFTEPELATAFTLLLPREAAARTAERWFAMMSDDIDDDGNYVAERDNWRPPPASRENVVVTSGARQSAPTSGSYEQLRNQSVTERANFLVHLSHFHLHIVMLVSKEACDRIAAFLGYDVAMTEQVTDQMKLIVNVMGVSSN
jgi:hypothetical protein